MKCGEMGGLEMFCLALSAEKSEKVTVNVGEIVDFFQWNRWIKLWNDFVKWVSFRSETGDLLIERTL